MQPTLTTPFPSGSTWSQAYGWPSKLAQDPQHRHTPTGWSATAVWGTHAGESTGAVFSRPLRSPYRSLGPKVPRCPSFPLTETPSDTAYRTS
jgi:hypothetical protein